MKASVIVFPGSNCDRDVQTALSNAIGKPVEMVWHGESELTKTDLIVLPGGFSYGDVLGAGGGWAKSILFNAQVRRNFSSFFENPNTLTLGVCNGCQMVSLLKDLIPGAENWPSFVRNRC